MQYEISFLFAFLSLVCLIAAARAYPSITWFIALTVLLAFIIRPYLILKNDFTLLTFNFYEKSIYSNAFLLSTISSFICSLGILFGQFSLNTRELSFIRQRSLKLEFSLSNRLVILVFNLNIFFGVIFIFMMGENAIFSNRLTTISISNSFMRYMYTPGVVFASIGLVHAILGLQLGVRKWLFFAYIVFCIFLHFLYGVRGFAIYFSCITLGIIFFSSQKFYIKNILIFAIIFIIIVSSKELMNIIFSSNQLVDINQNKLSDTSPDLIETILLRTEGDTTESWMVMLHYLHENDFLYGKSLINNFFNFFPHTIRQYYGLLNGQDIINNYYDSNNYWQNGFGFNVVLPMELYLNFGIFSFPLLFLLNFWLGREIVIFFRQIFVKKKDPGVQSLKLYAIFVLSSSFGGLQWVFLFISCFIIFRLIEDA